MLPPTMRRGPSGPTKPMSSVLDRAKVALRGRAGSMPFDGFDADKAYPGPRARGGPMNPGPMPLPPTSGPMNPGPMPPPPVGGGMKRGGKVKSMSSGGSTSKSSSASKRGDGIAQRGKTKGRMC
jgi:hypothetical protein